MEGVGIREKLKYNKITWLAIWKLKIILLTHWIFFALLFKEEARSQFIMFQGCVFLLRFIFSMKQRPDVLCNKIRNESVLLGRKSYADSMLLWALKILEIGCDKMLWHKLSNLNT